MPGASLAWVADVDMSSARLLARAFKCLPVEPREIDGHLHGIDVLLIAVPYGVRLQYYERLRKVSADVSLFVEKPVARTVAEHISICGLRPPHRIACGYSRRVLPVVEAVKQMIGEGFWGRLNECSFGIGAVGGYSVGDKYYADPVMAGGGLMMEIGVHCIDAVLFCTGGTPAGDITGQMILDNGIDIHTKAETQLRLADGTNVPFAFEVTLLEETEGRIELVFDRHVLSFSLFDDSGILVRKIGGKSGYTVAVALPRLTGYQMLGRFWMRYFEALETGVVNETCSVTSLGVTQMVQAAYELVGCRVVPLAENSMVSECQVV
jgi:predicted dehydrogenase